MILTSLAPYNCYFCQDNRYQFLSGCYENTNFRALFSAEAALEEIPDALEGDGVAVKPQEPDLDEEETCRSLDRVQGRTQHLLFTTTGMIVAVISFEKGAVDDCLVM